MLNFKKFSLAISILLFFTNIGISQSYQDKYLQKSHETKSFDQEQWQELRRTVSPETGGNTDNYGNKNSEGDWDSYNFDTEDSDIPEGDNYDYEYEEYNDEYSDNDPNDPYDHTDYQRNNTYRKNRSIEGYDHFEKQRSVSSPRKRRIRKPKNPSTPNASGGASFLQVLLWIVIIVALSFLIYYFFINGDFKETGTKIQSDFEEMSPSEIPKSELERRLEVALKENNYREAVRIYFIFTLKDLSTKNWISWEKEKTNISYLYEMRGKDQYQQFNEAVNIYDQVWYGKIEITQDQYFSIEPKYKSLLNSINSK